MGNEPPYPMESQFGYDKSSPPLSPTQSLQRDTVDTMVLQMGVGGAKSESDGEEVDEDGEVTLEEQIWRTIAAGAPLRKRPRER